MGTRRTKRHRDSSRWRPWCRPVPAPPSLFVFGGDGEFLPFLHFSALGLVDPQERGEGVLAEEEQERRVGGLDSGDDRPRSLGGVSGLGAVHGVVFLAALSRGVGVIRDGL